jgi:hypothetical protein
MPENPQTFRAYAGAVHSSLGANHVEQLAQAVPGPVGIMDSIYREGICTYQQIASTANALHELADRLLGARPAEIGGKKGPPVNEYPYALGRIEETQRMMNEALVGLNDALRRLEVL